MCVEGSSAFAFSDKPASYLQGTWTGALTPAGGSITMNATACKYVKIGNLVYLCGYLSVTSVSSPTGALTITGLPFAPVADLSNLSAVSLYCSTLNATGTTSMQGQVERNSSVITITHFTAGAKADAAADIKASSEITFSAFYITA